MNDEKIVLVARLKVKADAVEEAKKAALAIVADSRAEAGNINYDIHQAIDDATVFVWHETWANNTQGPPGGLLCGTQTQFPEPFPGVSGFVHNATDPITAINIVDHVIVPTNIRPGSFLLSWRWDCEQSPLGR